MTHHCHPIALPLVSHPRPSLTSEPVPYCSRQFSRGHIIPHAHTRSLCISFCNSPCPMLTNSHQTAPNKPDYSVTLTPTPTLLFHYSALTYNAHRIHLDRTYCREVDGHRDLLVHGPLTVTLMLSVLQSRLAQGGEYDEFADSIDYRHLAPLYVEEPLRICVARQQPRNTGREGSSSRGNGRRDETAEGKGGEKPADDGDGLEVERNKWDIWVENHHGGLCVKGTAETVKRRSSIS